MERDVTFEATRPGAELEERLTQGESDWVKICEAPCTARVRLGSTYRVGGQGVTTSAEFVAQPGAGPLHVRADAGSDSAHETGRTLTIVGGLGAALGLFVLTKEVFATADCGGCKDQGDRKTGFVFLGAGGAAFITEDRGCGVERPSWSPLSGFL